MIQSLKKFVSMAIQGIQVPMYTNTVFLYFSDFSFLFLFWKQNKIKIKQPNKNKQTHESMIPKADKKSSKESLTLDRKN